MILDGVNTLVKLGRRAGSGFQHEAINARKSGGNDDGISGRRPLITARAIVLSNTPSYGRYSSYIISFVMVIDDNEKKCNKMG
jgi:hypothetical protein